MEDHVGDLVAISGAAARFGLSRATLLYYDRIGILRPGRRNRAGYRFYTPEDLERLSLIVQLRKAGTPMKEIAAAIMKDPRALAGLILKRLGELTRLLGGIKQKQSEAIGLLATLASREGFTASDLETIIAEAKIEAPGRKAWHDSFARESPVAHEELIRLIRGITMLHESAADAEDILPGEHPR